jgi:hypothetical protein
MTDVTSALLQRYQTAAVSVAEQKTIYTGWRAHTSCKAAASTCNRHNLMFLEWFPVQPHVIVEASPTLPKVNRVIAVLYLWCDPSQMVLASL